jgi:hypothetical protein
LWLSFARFTSTPLISSLTFPPPHSLSLSCYWFTIIFLAVLSTASTTTQR